jgi:sigma-B regulation protein RsbU (phosphoserine phosphatase)
MVGDVSGKGVGPALFMARTKTLFGTISVREASPAAILDAVNRELCRENDAGMFVTVVCGALDPATGEVVCAIGGHDAPYVVGADGAARQAPLEGGPLLGLMDDAAYPEVRLTLAPGESLVAFSDGVSEAASESGELFGLERIEQALSGPAAGSAGSLRDRLLEAVRGFVGQAPQSDDLTLLVLRRTDPA